MTIRATEDDHFRADHVRGMVSAGDRAQRAKTTVDAGGRFRACRWTHEPPGQLVEVGYIQSPDVVECSDTVSTTKDIDTVLVKASCVGAPFCGYCCAVYDGLCVSAIQSVEDVYVVVVGRTVAATEDHDLLANCRACSRSQWRWNIAAYCRLGPAHAIGIEYIKVIKALRRVTSTESVYVVSN